MDALYKTYAEYLQPPLTFKYWRVIAYTLKPFGIGKQEWWGLPKQPKIFDVMYYVTMIFGPVSLFSQFAYLLLYYHTYSFIKAANIFCVFMAGCFINARLLCARQSVYKQTLTDFMSIIHIYYYEPKSEFIIKTLVKAEKYTRWTVVYMFAATEMDLVCGSILPVYNNFYKNNAFSSNGTVRLETLVYVLAPFDYEYNIRNWIILNSFNVYLTQFGCGLFMMSDSIFYGIMFNLLGRIEILNHSFEELKEKFDTYSDKEVQDRLRRCIQDHTIINSCFSNLEESFGTAVTALYLINLVIDSVLILEFRFGDTASKITFGIMACLYMGILIIASYFLELMCSKNEELTFSAYDMPWEKMTIPHRKIFLILLLRVQKKMRFTGFAGVQAGYAPAISILKSTFSYFVLLKSRIETMGQESPNTEIM